VLAQQLTKWRDRSYAELSQLLDADCESIEVTGPSGAVYQIEIRAIWDDQPGGVIRVIGSVDDGGWRAFLPLTDDFLRAPDGSFVDE
jgi:hypothetical protein